MSRNRPKDDGVSVLSVAGFTPPETFAEPSWKCPLCRDLGWVEAPDPQASRYTRAVPCECAKAAARRDAFGESGVPPRFAACAFGNFEAKTVGLKSALRKAREFTERFEPGMGLLFLGPPGVGKTHLAVAVMRELAKRYGVRGRFEDFSALLARIRSTYNQRGGDAFDENSLLAPVREVEMLLLDDLGAARPSDWVLDILYLIVNDRYVHGRTTLVTTNFLDDYPDAERRATLEERVGERIRSRLYEMCDVVPMSGNDYRRSRKKT